MAFARRNGARPIYRTAEHRKARKDLLDAFEPGDPCSVCHHPMFATRDGKTSHLHADHDPEDPSRYRGLAHGWPVPCQVCGRYCNQHDGAKRARAAQGQASPAMPGQTTLQW